MPSVTSVKYTNKKLTKTLRIVGIAAIGIAIVTVGIIAVIRSGVFTKKENTDARPYYMSSEMSQVSMESDLQTGYMFSRTKKLLMEDRQTEPWVLNWYVISGTTRSVPAMQSQYVDTFDQVLLLESYVMEGDRSSAKTLMKAIDTELTSEDGMLLAFLRRPENSNEDSVTDGSIYENTVFESLEEAPVSVAATTRYIRALMNYYDKWGGSSILEKIETLSAKVYELGATASYKAADRMAAPTPIPVTEKSLITPIPEEKETNLGVVSVEGIELASLDLEALRRSAVLFPEEQAKYEELVQIVKNGKISKELPLYAWTYMGDDTYNYYAGSDMSVELVPSLYIMVYLAEIGELDQDGYAWVAQEIYDNGYLYESYQLISGQASSEKEALEAYPLVLYLAMIKGDDELFEATFSAMMRDYATLDRSEALYLYFRNVENDRIAVYARENLLAEIYIR